MSIIEYPFDKEYIDRKKKEEIDENEEYLLYETPEKTSDVNYRLRNESYEVDYISKVSSDEFMKIYNRVINSLSELERMVMSLVFDINGYQILDDDEIGEIIGISEEKVTVVKEKALRKLRRNPNIIECKKSL